jgi:Effector-associated domain 10
LGQWLSNGGVQNLQFVGKYNANIAEGQDLQIGERIDDRGLDAEAIREVVRVVTQGSNAADIRSILKEEWLFTT